MLNRWIKGLLAAGCAAGVLTLAGCEATVEAPPVQAEVGVDGGVVDIGPDVFWNYYNEPWGAGGWYVYHHDHGYDYLYHYHAGPHGGRVLDRTFRVRGGMVHHELSEQGHARMEHGPRERH